MTTEPDRLEVMQEVAERLHIGAIDVEDALKRFRWQHRHLTKRIRKFQRHAGPLMRRIDRVLADLAEPKP